MNMPQMNALSSLVRPFLFLNFAALHPESISNPNH